MIFNDKDDTVPSTMDFLLGLVGFGCLVFIFWALCTVLAPTGMALYRKLDRYGYDLACDIGAIEAWRCP